MELSNASSIAGCGARLAGESRSSYWLVIESLERAEHRDQVLGWEDGRQALEKELGVKLAVPPTPQIVTATGAALLAQDRLAHDKEGKAS